VQVQSGSRNLKHIGSQEIIMYGQPCFEVKNNGNTEYYLNFAKIFSEIFKVSSKMAEEYTVMIIQDGKKVITHPLFLIKKNYKIVDHKISLFGETFDLYRTLICLGYIATFTD